jgi:hypothetical protein
MCWQIILIDLCNKFGQIQPKLTHECNDINNIHQYTIKIFMYEFFFFEETSIVSVNQIYIDIQ